MSAKKTDLEVLSPSPVEVVIADRTFIQKPLSLRGTAKLVTIISEEFRKIAGSAALAALMEQDLSSGNAAAFLPGFLSILEMVPEAIPALIAVMLTSDVDDEIVEFLNDHCPLDQAFDIARTFFEQNQPEKLIANFTYLRLTLTNAVSGAKAQVAKLTM